MRMPRLKFVASIIAVQSPSSNDVSLFNGGTPFLQGKAEFGPVNPFPKFECAVAPRYCEAGDILVSVRAPVGAINLADQRYGIGRGLNAVRAKAIEPGLLRWVLEASEQRLRSEANGSTFEAITAWNIGEVPYVDCSRSTQRTIADYLDRETAEIDAMLAKMNSLSEALAERKVLVIQNLTQRSDSGVRWTAVPTAHLFSSIGSGTTPKGVHYYAESGSGIPWVTTSELRESVIVETIQDVTEEAVGAFSALRVHPRGSVVIAMYGATIGRLAMLGVDAAMNQACCAFSRPRNVDSRFFYYALWGQREELILEANGGGQPNISQGFLRRWRVPCPPLVEQRRIADHLDEVTGRIDTMHAKIDELKALLVERRAALITDVLTGRKQVPA